MTNSVPQCVFLLRYVFGFIVMLENEPFRLCKQTLFRWHCMVDQNKIALSYIHNSINLLRFPVPLIELQHVLQMTVHTHCCTSSLPVQSSSRVISLLELLDSHPSTGTISVEAHMHLPGLCLIFVILFLVGMTFRYS